MQPRLEGFDFEGQSGPELRESPRIVAHKVGPMKHRIGAVAAPCESAPYAAHARHALARGAELITVRDNLRHASISMTSTYLSSDEVERARTGLGNYF